MPLDLNEMAGLLDFTQYARYIFPGRQEAVRVSGLFGVINGRRDADEGLFPVVQVALKAICSGDFRELLVVHLYLHSFR
jgi:hypothetical protein